MKLDLQQVKKYHSKANLRAFMEHIRKREVEKVDKMLDKCLDPNFHDEASGGKFKSILGRTSLKLQER